VERGTGSQRPQEYFGTPKPDKDLKQAIKAFRELSDIWSDLECAICLEEMKEQETANDDSDGNDSDGNGSDGNEDDGNR
jgi:hypothetical protein